MAQTTGPVPAGWGIEWLVKAKPRIVSRGGLRLKATQRGRLPGIALARIGRTTEERARWLLGFAERDLERITAQDWEHLRWEAHAFVTLPAARLHVDVEMSLPPDDTIRRWQQQLRAGLTALVQGGEWRLPLKVEQVLKFSGGVVECGATGTSSGDLFKAEVCETLKAERVRFRSCQNCRRAFIARKRQAYCTGRCSQVVRTRRFQENRRQRRRESGRRPSGRKGKAANGQTVKATRET